MNDTGEGGPPPGPAEAEACFVGLLAGRISRDAADRWAGHWLVADFDTEAAPAVELDELTLWALDLLYGIDMRHGPDGPYLFPCSQIREWLTELRRHRRRGTLP